MEGRPVWLASIATRDATGEIVPTGKLSRADRDYAEAVLGRALLGVGDMRREVLFRMNVTICRHRGLTEQEEANLPADFHEFCATDTAGGAVELLWKKGVSGDAIEPCLSPGREPIPGSSNPDLWLPVPCGTCAPCVARDALRA